MMWVIQMHKSKKDLILFFQTICENMKILQNGSIIQLHSNKGISCNNIYSEIQTKIIAYGQKMLPKTTLLK
jgi:hypothetical protein